jgi:lipid II:glycine glycyltransferase (peptidoglycan interpeptide bridge formation enzyme)
MKPKTRYNIGLAERRGVTVDAAGLVDLPAFYTLLEETAKRDRFYIRPIEYYAEVLEAFGADATLLLAKYDGTLLGGIVVVTFGDEATYLYGASSNEHRNLMPTYLLQWQGMMWAMGRGCSRYDLWGIPKEAADDSGENDDERVDGLWGVYRFKQGFGGRRVSYAGAFDYVYAPLRYNVMRRLVPLAQRFLGLRADFGR